MSVAAQARTTQAAGETPARKAAAASGATGAPAKKGPAKKVPATKTAAKRTPAKPRLSAADLAEFTELITAELARVREEYDSSMAMLEVLKSSGQDSAGDDPADAGAKTFEREQEMSLANNRLDLMAQMERALARIAEGSYGVCESCGAAIPKGRLQAFPQATLCVACKSREERR